MNRLSQMKVALERRRAWDTAELRAWRCMAGIYVGGFLYIDPDAVRSRTLDQLQLMAINENAWRYVADLAKLAVWWATGR